MGGGRMKAVQQTIHAQIKEMVEKNPLRKVGLVTFTDFIEIIGDGSQASTRINSDKLNDYNFILKSAVSGASV